ncbi:carboxylesterase/lipase family protein [Hydrocarboniphaga effusa]|jgi:para-nitrobenzyl esterase
MRVSSQHLSMFVLLGSLHIASSCAAPQSTPPAAERQAAVAVPGTGQTTATVRVETGVLQGAVSEAGVSYKNIPYAAPPVGDRRWRAPAPAERWDGVRDATRYGRDCMQNRQSWDSMAPTQPQSEDCLYLNIWSPASAGEKSKLPVLVAIHGGGFVAGAGSQAVLDGSKLSARGAIIVTFNYRLGRFGFFAHPALSAESPGSAVGNYGFMDQIAALQWVQRNIAAFGGDPANVTVFGESAGGESINYLMLAADARGLFAKAMVQSGGGRSPWPKLSEDRPNLPSAEAVGRKFATKAKVASDDAAALRAVSAAKVLGGISLIDNDGGTYSGPMIDGRIVTAAVSDGFAQGRQAQIPYWIGSNSNEFGFLPGFLLGRSNSKLVEQFGFDEAQLIAGYGSKDAYEANFASDVTFTEPARYLATAAAAKQPVYLWRFAYVVESKRKSSKGAAHATDLPFTLGNLAANGDKIGDADRLAAQQFGDALIAFARTGVPAIEGQPAWPRYAAKEGRMVEFSEKGIVITSAASLALDAIAQQFAKRTSAP